MSEQQRWLVWVGLGLVVAVPVVFVLVVTHTGSDGGRRVVTVPVLPIDAGPADAQRRARQPPVRPTVDARLARGRLQVDVVPYARVQLDRLPLGKTPVDRRVPVGRHRLLLWNPDTGQRRSTVITIRADRPTIINRWPAPMTDR